MTTERDETAEVKVETIQQRETNVGRKEEENLSVAASVVQFVTEGVTTRRREMIVATMATRVGMRVVDLETQVTTNRIAEHRGMMTILVRVRTVAMTAIDADVVPKERRDPIVG